MLRRFLAALLSLVALTECRQGNRQVLLLSFDGFRWDYVGKYYTPNLDWIAETGVHAKRGVRSAFVTKTFPDHYTIVTGLYEENHGIVNNKMYDPEYDELFNKTNKDPKWWNDGEPLWVTAKLQGLKTGAYFWPGSEVKVRGVMPDAYLPYKTNTPFNERVDTALDWLIKQNMDLVVVYFHEPDRAGHRYGAMSDKVGEAVRTVDETLGYLIHKLRFHSLLNKVDLIIVSDHGMTNVTMDKEHVINLGKYLDMSSEVKHIPQQGAVGGIWPKEGKNEDVYQKLKDAHPHMKVYKKEEIPDHYHYKHHRRICPIVAVADEGYYIVYNKSLHYETKVGGEHGYDNDLPSMHPIFYARGPDFKMNYTREEFDTVNIYPLICHLLHIKPAPNDGSVSNVKDLLINDSKDKSDDKKNDENSAHHLECIILQYMALFLITYGYSVISL